MIASSPVPRLALGLFAFLSACSSDAHRLDLLPEDPPPAHCGDRALSGNETDVDCGGDCPGCSPGMICEEAADCIAGTECLGRKCKEP